MTTHRWLLLPGLDGTGRLFDRLVEVAREPCVTVAYPHDGSRYDVLESIVRDAVPAGPFSIIAESFSGPIGVRVAADPPPGLRRLVLVATFIVSPRPRWLGALARPSLFAFPPPRSAIRALLTGHEASDALVRDVQQAIAGVPATTLAARARQVLAVADEHVLTAVDRPMTYLQASRDRMVPSSAWRTIHRCRHDVQHAVVDAPHLLLQRAPEHAWAAIDATSDDRALP